MRHVAIRSRPRLRVAGLLLALAGVLAGGYAMWVPAPPPCDQARLQMSDGAAALVCAKEYERTGDPATGVLLANTLRRAQQAAAAKALATRLLGTSAHSDALQVLGKIAISASHEDAGQAMLACARAFHVAEHRPAALAKDDQALADLFLRQNKFAEALRTVDDCIGEARQASDPIVEGYCHVTAADALAKAGFFRAAQEELKLAATRFVASRDLAVLASMRGNIYHLYGLNVARHSFHAQAAAELESAISHARIANRPDDAYSAELNLAYSLAELGKLDEATARLEHARTLDTKNEDDADRGTVAARIAYRRGDFKLATTLHAAVIDRLLDPDIRVNACALQARIGLATNDLAMATAWAERGIESAEQIRNEQSAVELRPWVLSLRRQPYELLFIAQVQARRFEDAIATFDRWQGRALLDASQGRATATPSLREAAVHTETLLRTVPVMSSAPAIQPGDRTALLASLAGVDLVALVIAESKIWRISAHAGRFDITQVGALDQLEPVLQQFETGLTAELAEQLGVPLLGDLPFRTTNERLFVLLDGLLSNVPVAALRSHGRPLAAMRPIVRPPRLTQLRCVAKPATPRHQVVIADADGDLHAARALASVLGAPLVGPAATRAALFSAGKQDLLHVAVHGRMALGGGALALADATVSALEIAAHPAPATVILSACGSATADDAELASSVVTGFLAAGAQQVVGTLRPVSDVGAREVLAAFYREGGAADPARALARAQASLSGTTNSDWPNFAMFGMDTCQ